MVSKISVGEKHIYETDDGWPDFSAPLGSLALSLDSWFVKYGDGDNDWRRFQSIPNQGLVGGGVASGYRSEIYSHWIATLGSRFVFGNLSGDNRCSVAAFGSRTRAIFSGGENGITQSEREFVEFATGGDAVEVATLSPPRHGLGSCNSTTRTVEFGGDNTYDSGSKNTIHFSTFSTMARPVSFGTLTQTFGIWGAGCGSQTRGVLTGNGGTSHSLEYITIATEGNSATFGNLSTARYELGACSSSITGVFFGGYSPDSNVIDSVTISQAATAVSWGTLGTARAQVTGGVCSQTRAILPGGWTSAAFTSIYAYDFSYEGSETFWGGLTGSSTTSGGGCSNCHGGL